MNRCAVKDSRRTNSIFAQSLYRRSRFPDACGAFIFTGTLFISRGRDRQIVVGGRVRQNKKKTDMIRVSCLIMKQRPHALEGSAVTVPPACKIAEYPFRILPVIFQDFQDSVSSQRMEIHDPYGNSGPTERLGSDIGLGCDHFLIIHP